MALEFLGLSAHTPFFNWIKYFWENKEQGGLVKAIFCNPISLLYGMTLKRLYTIYTKNITKEILGFFYLRSEVQELHSPRPGRYRLINLESYSSVFTALYKATFDIVYVPCLS